MKMKSFMLLAISGLLATSFAYATPSVQTVDDMSANPSMPSSAPSDMSNNGQNASGMNNDTSGNTDNSQNMGASPSSDEGTPDTATGDDDY